MRCKALGVHRIPFWACIASADMYAMSLSAAPSPTAPAGGAIAAPLSAPLPEDVLTVESLGKDLDVAALGVSLSFLALLDEHTVPGWLPGLLDEQRCPLYGPISFCFTEDHGAVPIGVVRLNARCHSPHPRQHTRHRPPNLQPRPPTHPTPNLQPTDAPIRPAPRRASPHDGRRAGHGLLLC